LSFLLELRHFRKACCGWRNECLTAQTKIRPDVLVVDDSNTIRRSAEIFLSQAGYSVRLAQDGFEALSSIVEQTPALIFCDILMPRLDGYPSLHSANSGFNSRVS
jgi:CheY-like chemotaxis protein